MQGRLTVQSFKEVFWHNNLGMLNYWIRICTLCVCAYMCICGYWGESVCVGVHVYTQMCACVCPSMGACVCVRICVDLMGFGRDLDKRIQVLSGNNYLSLTKSNKKERKRKPTRINFLIDPPCRSQYWAKSPSNWDTMTGPYVKTSGWPFSLENPFDFSPFLFPGLSDLVSASSPPTCP